VSKQGLCQVQRHHYRVEEPCVEKLSQASESLLRRGSYRNQQHRRRRQGATLRATQLPRVSPRELVARDERFRVCQCLLRAQVGELE